MSELVAQLTVRSEPREEPVQARVERGRGADQTILAGERNGQDIGFRLFRRHSFDLDSHGRAMLADGPRSLLPREGDIPSARCGR